MKYTNKYNYIMTISEELTYIEQNNKIALLHIPNQLHRKRMHQEIEKLQKQYLNKYSVYHPNFTSKEDTILKCDCNGKVFLKYHDGIMPNNEDQFVTLVIIIIILI